MTVSDLLNGDEEEILAIDGMGEKTLEDAYNLVAAFIEADNAEEIEEEVDVEELLDDLEEQEAAEEEAETETAEDDESETTAEETPLEDEELTLEEESK